MEEEVFIELAFKMQFYTVKNTLLQEVCSTEAVQKAVMKLHFHSSPQTFQTLSIQT